MSHNKRQWNVVGTVRHWFIQAAKHLNKGNREEAEGCFDHARQHLALLDDKYKEWFFKNFKELPAYSEEMSAPRIDYLLESSAWSEWRGLNGVQVRRLIKSLSSKVPRRRH